MARISSARAAVRDLINRERIPSRSIEVSERYLASLLTEHGLDIDTLRIILHTHAYNRAHVPTVVRLMKRGLTAREAAGLHEAQGRLCDALRLNLEQAPTLRCIRRFAAAVDGLSLDQPGDLAACAAEVIRSEDNRYTQPGRALAWACEQAETTNNCGSVDELLVIMRHGPSVTRSSVAEPELPPVPSLVRRSAVPHSTVRIHPRRRKAVKR